MKHSIKNTSFSFSNWSITLDNSLTRCLLNMILLIIIIPLFVPFTPKMPAPGVDPSWALGLNHAVAQGLAFGKDILFTLGPYSSIYTKFYHPVTDSLMLWGSLYLACSYWFALIILNKKMELRWIMALSFFLLTLVYAKDSLLFSYPVLVALIVFRNLESPNSLPSATRYLILILLLAPLGLLPLIKGSLLILCCSITFLCAVLFLFNRHYCSAVLTLVIPQAALILFWALAGQSIGNLPQYIVSSLRLAFSFTEAMSTIGNNYEVVSYVVTSLLVLYVVIKEPLSTQGRLFLSTLFFLFLFLSFKAGFARHFGHALIPGTSVLLAALLLPYCVRSKYTVPVLLVALSTSLYIEAQYTQIVPLKNIQSTYSAAWHGLWHRRFDKEWLNTNFSLTMNYLRAKNQFPILPGSSDIYSYEQTDLIASGNKWSPRPIFQSYSVFNDVFAKTNQQHLLSSTSPDNIFFKMQPIDNRFPTLEDGVSWLVLLTHYQPKIWVRDFLLLQKKSPIKEFMITEVGSQKYHLGETVKVPQTDSLVFVELEIKPTVWGALMKFLFKPQELSISVWLTDGSQKHYRMIAEMARSGFLLSPFIERTEHLELLYQQDLNNKKITSFIIQSQGNAILSQWQNQYQVKFKLLSGQMTTV